MTSHRASFLVLTAVLLTAGCAATPARAPAQATATAASPTPDAVAAQWRADVAAISAGADGAARRAAIVARLRTLGLSATQQAFRHESEEGVNLLVDLGGPADAPLLLLGAHADRVDQGEGATDNASGSATVLGLAQALKARPLVRHRVALAFWDLEEKGLRGARAYVAQKSPKPALYVNFDVFGWGDTLWMMTPDTAHPIVTATRTAAEAAGLQVSAGDRHPPTDHLAFLEAGWPAVSYSLVDHEEVPQILEVFAGRKPAQVPKVMRVIHSAGDLVSETDPQAAARGVTTLEAALRAWDAASAATR